MNPREFDRAVKAMEVIKSGAARKRPATSFEFTKKSTAKKARRSQPKSVQAIAKKVFSDSMEHKYLDLSRIDLAIPISNNGTGLEVDPATQQCLNAINAGDSAQEREGKQVTMLSIQLSGLVRFPGEEGGGTTPHSAQNVFISLVWDKHTNRAQLNSEDVYSNLTGSTLGCAIPVRNPNDPKRYKVLKTWRLDAIQQNLLKEQLGVADGYTWNEQLTAFECFIKFNKPIKVRFVDTTTNPTTCGQIMDNSLHLIAGYSSLTTDHAPTITYASRVRFIDG